MLPIGNINLGYETKVDAELQQQIEAIDDELRTGFGMTALQTVASVLDLNAGRVSMI